MEVCHVLELNNVKHPAVDYFMTFSAQTHQSFLKVNTNWNQILRRLIFAHFGDISRMQ